MKNPLVIGAEKYINIKVAQGWGFVPVLSDIKASSDDISAVDGHCVFNVECETCGKRYYHNQGTRQYRHYRKHQEA